VTVRLPLVGVLIATLLSATFAARVAAQTQTPDAARLQPMAGAVPVQLDIPRIGTHASIVPLGRDSTGAMDAPTDPDTVGWFAPGMGVGTPGNMLLDGHVDWGGRLRVFGLLGQLGANDTLQVTDVDGNVATFVVTWIQLYAADNAPVSEIFKQTPDEEVTLITCGGAFDRVAHIYVSRWVVRAVRTDQ
jgi:sortase (surface protein transpeptidase)